MLTLLASIAQEQSRSDSENQKWRIRKNFEEGKPWNGTILGYRYVDGKFEIEPGEAETVRKIFSLYLSGQGYRDLCHRFAFLFCFPQMSFLILLL